MPKEIIPASRKLSRVDAISLAASAESITIAKGKKVASFVISGEVSEEIIDGMLGPTGNLRAPTIVAGKKVIVGYNEDCYREILFK